MIFEYITQTLCYVGSADKKNDLPTAYLASLRLCHLQQYNSFTLLKIIHVFSSQAGAILNMQTILFYRTSYRKWNCPWLILRNAIKQQQFLGQTTTVIMQLSFAVAMGVKLTEVLAMVTVEDLLVAWKTEGTLCRLKCSKPAFYLHIYRYSNHSSLKNP